MKFLVVLAVVLSVAYVQSSEEETKQLFIATAQECKTKEGASEDDFSNLVVKKPPTTHEGKCLGACIFEKMGIIKDGKMNREGFIAMVSKFTNGDATKIKIAEELADLCEKTTDGDRCELAFKLGDCIKTEGMKKKQEYGL